MEEEKTKDYERSVRKVLIVFGVIIGLIMMLFMSFVVSAIEEQYSRAENANTIENKNPANFHHVFFSRGMNPRG